MFYITKCSREGENSHLHSPVISRLGEVYLNRAEAEAKLLTAEAEAQAIRKIALAVEGSGANPAQYLIAVRYLETLKEMTSGKDNKTVYLPYEASGVLSSLGGIKELLK